MKKLPKQNLNDLFAPSPRSRRFIFRQTMLPVQAQFTLWHDGMTLSRRHNTARSAKDLFFPQVENLAGFRREGKAIEIFETRDETKPFAVFGVRACDARSFELLDRVFLNEPVDTFYAARREAGTIITLACERPDETCFCSCFGIDPGASSRRCFLLDGRSESLLAGEHRKGKGADRLPFHAGGLRGRRCAGAAGKNPWNSGTAAACEARSVRRRRGEDEAAV